MAILSNLDKVARESEGLLSWETDEMTDINWPPAQRFVECTEVNLFNTTLCLPPEGGQQSVTPFVAGNEMNNLSG